MSSASERHMSAPSSLDADIRKATRGRLLLASGIPLLAAGIVMMGTGTAGVRQCDGDSFGVVSRGVGAAFATAGLGLSVPGIIQLVRASDAAKQEPRSKAQRKKLTRLSIAMTLTSIAVGMGLSWSGQICWT